MRVFAFCLISSDLGSHQRVATFAFSQEPHVHLREQLKYMHGATGIWDGSGKGSGVDSGLDCGVDAGMSMVVRCLLRWFLDNFQMISL